ncbi:MAG: hypothetical protein MI784_11185 [Cytophagales bacterium]|nr:hypothetical protein [Cytophagales bacterium]
MAIIDRNSAEDAKAVFEKLLPNQQTRVELMDFLIEAISYADFLNNQKWNLNLDKNGNFIRFNTGHEYCIQVRKDELLILCDRITLKPIVEKHNVPVMYRGNAGRETVHSESIDKVPDCLAKTKNSVGCLLPLSKIEKYLHFFKSGNKDFIKEAIKTCHMPQMKVAQWQNPG